MELVDYEITEYVESGGYSDIRDFQFGNGKWWQNSYYFEDGFGFGFKDDFATSNNEYFYSDYYPINSLFTL